MATKYPLYLKWKNELPGGLLNALYIITREDLED